MAQEGEVIHKFLEFFNDLRKEYANEPRHNLKRQEIIRALLKQCRSKFPLYNVVIAEQGFANFLVENIIIDEKFEMQDVVRRFKFRLVVFKTGSVSILSDVLDGKIWGIYIFYLCRLRDMKKKILDIRPMFQLFFLTKKIVKIND